MAATYQILPVILSGGSGTRLWPLSRTGRPKQLLSLTHEHTMLQLTARRASGERFLPPVVVANVAHAEMIEAQLAEVGLAPELLILEPIARNTAPAIALAALTAPADTLMLVMPSDHVILDADAFRAAIEAATPLVAEGWLATFGITPDAAEIGYGYIRRGEALSAGVHRVSRFVEKPDRETAAAYLADGNYSWNGGIFLFRPDMFMAELDRHAPEIAAAARASIAAGRQAGSRFYPDPQAFAASPSDSVDYAVMEKAERVAVVPVEMGWSDVGSWDALHQIAEKDGAGNASQGEVLAIDTSDCLIHSDGVLVAAVGVKDLIIVATKDAVLILPRGSSQEVKRAVEALKKQQHITLDRPC